MTLIFFVLVDRCQTKKQLLLKRVSFKQVHLNPQLQQRLTKQEHIQDFQGGGHHERQRRELSRGSGGMLSQKSLKICVSKMAISSNDFETNFVVIYY